MVQRQVFFENDKENQLEGILHVPEKIEKRVPGILVLHPHPLYGGSMHNNVVEAICQGAIENNMIALRYNCRGVGKSEGNDPSEKNGMIDTKSAIKFMNDQIKEVDLDNIGFCGYSWGSKVGLEASHDDERIKYLIAISPPLGMFSFEFLKQSKKPKFFIVGDRDQFCPAEIFGKFWRKLTEPYDTALIEDADHFLWGFEGFLKQKVFEFINELKSEV